MKQQQQLSNHSRVVVLLLQDLTDGCQSRISPHAIALSTLRISSRMRLGSAVARAHAPTSSLSARSHTRVERQHFVRASLKRRPRNRKKGAELLGIPVLRSYDIERKKRPPLCSEIHSTLSATFIGSLPIHSIAEPLTVYCSTCRL